jgi:hypothetical protein
VGFAVETAVLAQPDTLDGTLTPMKARDALPVLKDLAARGDKSAATAIPKIEADSPPAPQK